MRPSPILVALLACACSSAPPNVVERLQECGLVGDGVIGRTLDSTFYAPDACYRQCLGEATCEELEAALCRSSLELLLRCDQRCAHHCPDGTLIALDQVCDGAAQCADMTDEQGCPTFRCRDGRDIPQRSVCNGWSECGSGEDEADCSGLRCDGPFGEVRGDWYRCDGTTHCSDGSDERDCATITCTDGTRVPHRDGESPICDGRWSCSDGSDEQGCAQLVPSCSSP